MRHGKLESRPQTGCGAIRPLGAKSTSVITDVLACAAFGAVEYERVPRHLQARVLGTVGALAFAGIPFGGHIAGAAVSAIGLRAALVAAALAYGLVGLPPFVLSAWHDMERRPEPSPQTSHAT